jgi:Methyltransferase domain
MISNVLEKTRTLLARQKAGTYVADDVECYDEKEIEELGRVLSGLVYAPSKLRKKLQSLGVTITRSDFYSEIPTVADLENSFSKESRLKLRDPFNDPSFLESFLNELAPFGEDFDPPVKPASDIQYGWESGGFSYSDAMAYYAMIRRYRPKTIIEMGCGSSTRIASLACEHNGCGRILAIEPFPGSYLSRIPHVEVVQTRAQDIDEAFIDENLDDGDILFIDTTHTVKHDSDCLHIYLRILPYISHNILVHAHDIYLPNPLPLSMMRDRQTFWNEQYLLYAYFLGNSRTRVLYGSRYHYDTNRARLTSFMQGRYAPGGASLWFSQSGLSMTEDT